MVLKFKICVLMFCASLYRTGNAIMILARGSLAKQLRHGGARAHGHGKKELFYYAGDQAAKRLH